jgi:UDP-N-acetylglucosamine 1-carboxyvinyltransferase
MNIEIPDLRAGFAYVMAALTAKDESVLSNLQFLDRGYEAIDEKLVSLGASLSRETIESPNLITV